MHPTEVPITLAHLIAIAGTTLVLVMGLVNMFANQFKARLDLQAKYTAETMQKHGDLAVSFASITGTIQTTEAKLISRVDLLTVEVKAINGRLGRAETLLGADHGKMIELVSDREKTLLQFANAIEVHADAMKGISAMLMDLRKGERQGVNS